MNNRNRSGGYYDEETGLFYEDQEQNRYYDESAYGPGGAFYDGDSRDAAREEDYLDESWYGDDYDGYYREEYDDSFREPEPPRMTMAARAAGKANTELYARPPAAERETREYVQRARQRRTEAPPRQYREPQQPRQTRQSRKTRRKKRHGFRNFILLLLFLAALLAGAWFLLCKAPEQTGDGWHTRKAGFYNILVCATDQEEMRTDTMMIATLGGPGGTLSLTSLPRDCIVDMGGWTMKLNGVYGYYGGGDEGARALLDQVEVMLGFRPDGYMIIGYEGFRDAVDALGGVKFDVPMEMMVDDPETGEDMKIYAGEQILDGRAALGVCRYRYGYMMADIQRQYVQQSFLKAMVRQCLSPKSWLRLPGMYQAVMNHTVTDLSGANIRYLGVQGALCARQDISQQTLPGEGVEWEGASCYGLYGGSVLDMVNAVMNPYEEDLTQDEICALSVWEGELVPSTWRGEAFDASSYDYTYGYGR